MAWIALFASLAILFAETLLLISLRRKRLGYVTAICFGVLGITVSWLFAYTIGPVLLGFFVVATSGLLIKAYHSHL